MYFTEKRPPKSVPRNRRRLITLVAVLFLCSGGLRDRGSLIVCEASLGKPDDSEDLTRHFSSQGTQVEVAALGQACRSKTTQCHWPYKELG